MKCVVLAGGGGLRLWPLSRKKYPKQFLKLADNNTMFQETILRNKELFSDFLIVSNYEFRYMIDKQLNDIGIKNSKNIYETVGRNTAPAITIASIMSNPDDILFVVPADAKINADELYMDAVKEAVQLAKQGYIVTFGIIPRSPHTGYGYIKYNGNNVEAFKEKPDLQTATAYLEQGGYLWNSGMFMFQAGVLLQEIQKYRSDIYDICVALCTAKTDVQNIVFEKNEMLSIPSESIDYAVMERSDRIKVVKSDFYWNDVGGFEALSDIAGRNTDENSQSGDNIIINNSHNVSVINDTADQLVIVNDIQDAIVVNTNDAVYVTKEGSSAEIKKIIEKNNEKYADFFGSTIINYRPWGYYEVLINSPGYKVKRITLYPKKRLSLQKHFHRSEHWIIVDGIANVTLGEKTFEACANESVYIPVESVHRLANNTEMDVSIIEVAVGNRIDEDDIVRLDDDFGR